MFDIFIMDMGGHDDNVRNLQIRFPHSRVVRYYDNHLDTIKRCISRSRTPYCWVVASDKWAPTLADLILAIKE